MLKVETIGHVRRLTLDRPEVRNALSTELASLLEEALREADADPAVYVVLLCGAGTGFSAGGDIRDFARIGTLSPAELEAENRRSLGLFALGQALRTPIVVAVHGYALGGGLGLVALGHVAITAPGTRFGLPEIKVGLWPYTIWPAVVRAIGHRRAMELALTGREFSAEEALQMGLVHRIVPQADLAEAAQAAAEQLAAHPRLAVRTGLEAAALVTGDPDDQVYSRLLALREQVFGDAAFRDRVTAFLHAAERRGGA